MAAVATLSGLYAGFAVWTYFAWYRNHKPLSQFKWGGDGWLGDTTYAGGADKFGHAWATMGLARAGTYLLSEWGSFDRRRASIISAALSETLFFFVEVKDGFYYEFSFSDITGDTTGMVLALLFDNFPRLDEMFDYRVQYWPSTAYLSQLKGGDVNIAEDYSGETFILAFHLASIHALRDASWGTWSRFVDLTVGFESRGYKPDPPQGLPDYDHHQNTIVGVSFNAQGFFDWVFENRKSHAAQTTRKATHALFEMFNVPYTNVPIFEHSHSPTGTVMTGGA